MQTQYRPFWRQLLAASLLVALLAGLGPAPATQAALRGCRADPVFILSDGTVLDVQVSIETDVSNVDGIHYVVHGPRGTWLISSVSTPTLGFKGLETVRYVADQAPNQYKTDTLVTTRVPNVRASSYTIFAATTLNLNLFQLLRLSAQYHVIDGWAGEHLIAYLQK